MKCVVDTNVLAYFLLKTEPFFGETASFWKETHDVLAPDTWRTEFANTLWMAVRQEILDETQAQRRLNFANQLITETASANSLAPAALHLSIQLGHPVYDTVFVALAISENLPLATYDRRLLTAFPEVAQTPPKLLSANESGGEDV